MNKIEAQKQITELKAKLSELEATVNEPEYNPEDLVGKLCYVWDSDFEGKFVRVVKGYDKHSKYPYKLCAVTTYGCVNAEPVPEEEVLKMVYRPKKEPEYGPWHYITFPAHAQKPSRYDWSKAPVRAKYIYTDSNGNIFWATIPFQICDDEGVWLADESEITFNWDYISRSNPPCKDWKESEEARPE